MTSSLETAHPGPLLGYVDLRRALRKWTPAQDHPAWDGQRLRVRDVLHWAIVGGESGAHARLMHPDWARSIRDHCLRGETAFHFKLLCTRKSERPSAAAA